jgi:putative ATPase
MRNAPTSLMKTLGYGEEYSYNPDYAHPVHNTYLPPTLASHSSHAADGPVRILRTADAEAATKTWNEGALQEWERSVNGGKEWEGRKPS